MTPRRPETAPESRGGVGMAVRRNGDEGQTETRTQYTSRITASRAVGAFVKRGNRGND
jgi:hypothetical protein